MAAVCAVLILGQINFDLALPDYMSSLTVLIKTPGSTLSDILHTGLEMLGCTLASAVLCVICGYLTAKVAAGFSFSIREAGFHKIADFGQQEMMTFSVPSLITRTTNDITQIQMIVAMGLQMLIKAPIMAVWAVIKILGKSWELSAVTAGFVVALCVMVLAIMSTCLPRFRLVQKLTDKINRVARENLTGINVVHAFNAEDYQNRKFDVPSRDMMNLQLKNQRLFALLQPMMGLGMNGLALAVYWVGAALVEAIPLADPAARLSMFTNVLVFSTYATSVVMSFMMLVMIFLLVPQAQVSAERINEVLDRGASIREGSVREGRSCGTVEFRDVSFRYPGSAQYALRHLNMKFKVGGRLAVVGMNGSGKTTFIKLLCRLYDPTEGVILLNGIDIRKYRYDEYMDIFSVVFQDFRLLALPLGQNVAACTGYDAARVTDCLQKAGFGERLAAMPQGLDTALYQELDENGVTVSGGEAQKIAIARALYKDAPFIILDEPTAALDPVAEAEIYAKFNETAGDKTAIYISHRLSSCKFCDEIAVFDHGEVIQQGTHEHLLADPAGKYYELWNAQAQYYTEEPA